MIARNSGKNVSSLIIQSLFPIPKDEIIGSIRNIKRVIIPEENMTGQYRSVIQHLLTEKEVISINKIGSMISPTEILEKFKMAQLPTSNSLNMECTYMTESCYAFL